MSRAKSILFLGLLAAISIFHHSQLRAEGQLPAVQRIVFVGDSLTHAGGYIAAIEAAAIANHPDRHIEFLNLGLPSETVSGLSEPGHAGGQFPRPDLHERLQRVLEQTKPDLVVACYGMNDGIYYPQSDDRFDKFKSGMQRLHDAVVARGAKIIHLTPAYFDALPIRARLLPAGKDEYLQPYEGYDDVLEAYAKWLLSKRADGWEVLDVHAAMKDAVQRERKSDPNFTFANDGVHPNAAGQLIVAEPLAAAWGLKLNGSRLPNSSQAESILKLVAQKQQVLKLAWLTATRHVRPGIAAGLPIEEAQAKAAELDKQARALVLAAATNAPKRIVLIAGKPSHPIGMHEFNAGVQLLSGCMQGRSDVKVEFVLNGWPKDESIFENAAAVIFYMDGGGNHEAVLEEGRRLKFIQKLTEKGVGIGCMHYAVEIVPNQAGKEFKRWIGGHYENMFSCNPMWEPNFVQFPKHPITNGVKPFAIKDEWYFNMRFVADIVGNEPTKSEGMQFTPILVASPSDDVRDGPYVYPKGPYPHIEANKGRAEAMMWAVERPDGGRGFGFTGGHFHDNWGNDSFRKVVLNAMLWLAKVDVPTDGVESKVTAEQLSANLDPKAKK